MGKAMSIEYLNPALGQESAHVFRYYMARGMVEPEDTVLDLGSGTGYGSFMLSKVAKKVLAFDIEEDLGESYRKPNIEFQKLDLCDYPLPEADVIVALEFIEHLRDPKKMALEIKRKAKKFIVLSFPKTPTSKLDITHLSDPNPAEVRSWIEDKNWILNFESDWFGLSIIQAYRYSFRG